MSVATRKAYSNALELGSPLAHFYMHVFFDTETGPIDRGRLAPKIVCVSYSIEGDTGLRTGAEARALVDGWLRSADMLVAHNASFDMAAICATWPELLPLVFAAYEAGRVECTMLRQRLADIASTGRLENSYSLKTIAARYGKIVDKDGGWRTGYSALRGIPVSSWPAGAVQYALEDAAVLEPIYRAQPAVDCAATARADFALHLASCWGVFTDKGRVEAFLKVVTDEQDRTRRYLQRAGLVRVDGTRDTKKAAAYMERLCDRRGKTVKRTDKGGVSLDADACTLSGSRLLELYSQFVSASGTRAKAEDLTYGYDLPLQTRYTSLVETSRTSSSKPALPLRGLQIQNPPNPRKKKSAAVDVRAGFRECLRPNGVFLIADYPSAELYSFAEVCFRQFGHSTLRDLLLSGKDVHCQLAATALGVSYETVYDQRKGKYKLDRDRAKPGNYGYLGGMGPDKFILMARAQYGILFTRPEVVALKAAWQRMLPETVEFFAWINRLMAGRREFTVTHPVTGFVRAGCTYTSGANFMFSHLTAEAVKAAFWEVTRRCYSDPKSALYGYRAPIEVHDEIICEGPEDTAHDAALELAHVMETVYNRYTPHVPLAVEACISRFWSKDACQVWHDGRLVPWEGK